MSLPLFLGVDGGGTKTRFVLVDRDGNLLASHAGAGLLSSRDRHGRPARRAAPTGSPRCSARRGSTAAPSRTPFSVFPPMAKTAWRRPLLDAMPEPLLGHRRYRCGNDMVCAWAGSLGGEDGINVVAGTGSIGYGERRGKSARAGGWGEVFGDEGSAYWIAVQGLNVFTRMSDGRLPKGPLHAAFRASFGLERRPRPLRQGPE